MHRRLGFRRACTERWHRVDEWGRWAQAQSASAHRRSPGQSMCLRGQVIPRFSILLLKRKPQKLGAQGQNRLHESLTARTFTGLDLACWIWTPYFESRGSKTTDLHITVSTINYWGFWIRNSKLFQHGILSSKFTRLFIADGWVDCHTPVDPNGEWLWQLLN
jgi:hypothetical protein